MHPGNLRCSPAMSRWNTSASSRLEVSGTSIAIIGAGAGLGAAVARRFGAEGGRIIPGDAEKDPGVLAGHLWDLHIKRDRFRHQVSAD